MAEAYDVIIIGGGIVGCATASLLSRYQLSVALLEKENDVSMGTTRANTAILHGGYDPLPGTKMAAYNVRGAEMARDICKKLKVPYLSVPSMVVAEGEEENAHIRKLLEQGKQNGVQGLSLLTGAEAREEEPSLSPKVTGALLVASAAIVDPMRYCIALARNAAANGVAFYLSTPVEKIRNTEDGYVVNERFTARTIVNAAGLWGDRIAAMVGDNHTITPVAGEYYLLDKEEGTRVTHTIFPCPSKKGKGVVCTPTVHGNLLVGPTADAREEKEDVSVTEDGLAAVRENIRKTVPGVDFSRSIRNFTGLRAYGETEDFIVEESANAKGVFHAIGIKSPGLTAAPAIAEALVDMILSKIPAGEKPEYQDHPFVSLYEQATPEEKKRMLEQRPAYGRIVCRCETVSQGEMEDQLSFPLPPTTLDGMKRRCGSGMGRCQGGFCSPKVHSLISLHTGIPMEAVQKDAEGSIILLGGKL